ncbi:hypothetical protein FJZ27_04310 [Candidatus Peribacteria bacterium]|nr:hypothetical protein [Candidatus Peribacteria bacterium]
MQKLLWGVFWITSLAIGMVVAGRLWHMRLLADVSVRSRVQQSLQLVAKREGWLISDMSIRSVTPDAVIIEHRQHMRGRDPRVCVRIPLGTLEILPCTS